MNVNGSRFHLLLGEGDWGACTDGAAKPTRIGGKWDAPTDPAFPWYDKETGQLGLLPIVDPIPDTPGEPRYGWSDHRDAAADRNGNLYTVADDRRALLVRSAGDERVTAFWPPAPARRAPAKVFADAAPDTPEDEVLTGLAVTSGDYLVAGFIRRSSGGLLRFDLVGGGVPERVFLPDGIFPAALAADCDGGLWLLDADIPDRFLPGPFGAKASPAFPRLLRLDRDLRLVAQPVETAAPAFADEDADPQAQHFRAEILSIDLTAKDPIAIAALCDGSLLLLDAPAQANAKVHIVDPGASVLRELIALDFPAFALAVGGPASTPHLLLAHIGGNQARRVALTKPIASWTASLLPDTLPLRRFGGRALVRIGEDVHYDSGAEAPIWVPVVPVRHRRFAKSVTFVTPIQDGAEPQCVWDRIRLDACIPASASVIIEARAADDRTALASPATAWIPQPALVLSPSGTELPGKRAVAAIATDRTLGRGSWDLLLQNVTGRYAQLRITLTGDERVTPRLRALRLWYPRFSWVRRFLPGVYREEPGSAAFLERFLANFEGMATAIEDRIAGADALLDPRTVPAEMLEWLSSWYDVALDPSWDERRRRLFIAHAAGFFGWRGTIRGLLLALKLALDTRVSAQDFDLARPACPTPNAIRIVESYTGRAKGRVFGPAAAPAAGPGIHSLDSDWMPEEGAAGLWARWPDKPAQLSGRFPLFPPAGHEAAWTALVRRQFGFVPQAGQAERARWQAFQQSIASAVPLADLPGAASEQWRRYAALPSLDRRAWQDFLRTRYRSVERLQQAHNVSWDDFALVPLPDHLPATSAAIRDWLMFEGQELPIARHAHRFSVLLPRTRVDVDPEQEERDLALARRIVALEKPAHTVFDVRFYWAMNRVGEARLGLDSAIGQGSRAPELVPGAVLGRAYVGAAFIGGPDTPAPGRKAIAC